MKRLCLGLAVLCFGCVTTAYTIQPSATPATNPSSTTYRVHALWGLVGDDRVEPHCPAEHPTIMRIENRLQAWSFLTFGLVTGTSTDVYCL
jgi:hypothetical protein